MICNNVKVISKTISKKGSLMVSLFRGADKLCDNCVVSNPLKLEVNANDVVSGDMIFNNNGLNTFVLTDVIKTK